MSRSRGVYFLANDRFLEYAEVFLSSFRRFNPHLPLRCVPFADDTRELERLTGVYDFSILRDTEALRACDGLSREILGRPWGHLRKLAMWEGEFDDFVYIDCDTVVLERVDFVFDLLAGPHGLGFLTAHGDDPATRQYVWQDSVYGTGQLSERQIAFSGATGFLASRRECLSLRGVLDRLPEILGMRPHFYPPLKDQPLLNFLMVTSGQPFASLHGMARAGDKDLLLEWWSRELPAPVAQGRVLWPRLYPPLLVHWSGAARHEGSPAGHPLWDFYRDRHRRRLRGEPDLPEADLAEVTCAFDDGTAQGWTTRSDRSRAVPTPDENARTGAHSLLVTGREGAWDGAILPLEGQHRPGSAYLLETWIRLAAAETATTALRLTVMERRGGLRTFVPLTPDTPVTGAGWTRLAGRYAPGAPADLRSVYVDSAESATGYRLDGFTLRRVRDVP